MELELWMGLHESKVHKRAQYASLNSLREGKNSIHLHMQSDYCIEFVHQLVKDVINVELESTEMCRICQGDKRLY